MANIRVGDLAKELNISNKEVLEALKKRNVELKSHLSAVQPEDADALRKAFQQSDTNVESERPRRPRPEGAEGERRRRPRPEGVEGERPRRPRPEGAEGERPRRPRPEGAERREDRKHNDTISAVEVMKPDSKENRRNAEKKREDKKREERQREDKKNSKNKNKGKVENKEALQKPVKQKPVEPEIKTITIPETLTIRDLADAMKVQPSVIIKQLFMAGVMATPNTEIDYEKAEEIALEYEILVEKEVVVDPLEEIMNDQEDPAETLQERPPVVCVMGHVDHGNINVYSSIFGDKYFYYISLNITVVLAFML